MKEIGLSNPSFEALVRGKAIYVDKTAYVYRMAQSAGYNNFYFISRPRRFGKSLMCSTLEALFSGKQELFEGLYIAGTDYEFKKYPVLRFDFSVVKAASYDLFITLFQKIMLSAGKANGVALKTDDPSAMLIDLLDKLENPVILIDEFDSPIIEAVSKNDKTLAEQMRGTFNSFYSIIKANTDKIRFFFLTGCTKLSGLNIFSAMNNLKDISRHPDYAGMFGYTEEELLSNFDGYIDKKFSAAAEKYASREDFISALKGYYDGYRFSPDSEVSVYNPVSVGNYFSDPGVEFSNYWMKTGGMSTLAITLAKNADLFTVVEGTVGIDGDWIDTFDIGHLTNGSVTRELAIGVLYYSGYLTIKDKRKSILLLGFPNTEVGETFTKMLVSSYSRDPGLLDNNFIKAQDAAENGDIRTMLSILNEHYKTFTYEDMKGFKELMVQVIFKSFCNMLSLDTKTEVPAGLGRADVILTTSKCNYIFELKVDSATSAEALAQIYEKKYAWYFREESPLHLVGIDFRTEKGQIVSYSHRLYGSSESENVSLV